MPDLFTKGASNAKTAKGAVKLSIENVILHLAPVDLAQKGRSVCPWASKGCAAACLNTAGRGQITGAVSTERLEEYSIHSARIRKTRELFADRQLFLGKLALEIARLQRRAERLGRTAAVRLNGTSDIPWESMRFADGSNLMEKFPAVQFYDYTKGERRFRAFLAGELPANYYLVFSRSEDTPDALVREFCDKGGTVAVVFRGDALPVRWQGFPVLDGLAHDFRYLDPRGSIVGLLEKGRAKHDATGFVVGSGAK